MVSGANGATWEEMTEAKLREARQREDNIRKQQKQLESEATYLSDYTNSLAKVLELDRQQRGIRVKGRGQVDPENLLKMSVREALIEIATANDGLLVVTMAVQIMVNAGYYQDREHARNSIYAALYHAKKDFIRERPGVYGLLPRAQPSLADKASEY
jgi:hypothetical protein